MEKQWNDGKRHDNITMYSIKNLIFTLKNIQFKSVDKLLVF